MKERLYNTATTTVDYVRDAHSNDFWIVEKEYADPIIERNKRIRLESLMTKGQKLPAFGDEVRFAFSIPPTEYSKLKVKEPDIWGLLTSKDPEDNMRGGQMLAILHPEWSTIEANR